MVNCPYSFSLFQIISCHKNISDSLWLLLTAFFETLICKSSLKGLVLSLVADGCISIDTFWFGSSQKGGENRKQNVLSIRKYSWTIYQSVQDAFSIPGNLTLFICNEIIRLRWEIAAEQFSGVGFIYHNFKLLCQINTLPGPNSVEVKALQLKSFHHLFGQSTVSHNFRQLYCMHLLIRHKIVTVFTQFIERKMLCISVNCLYDEWNYFRADFG